MFYPILLLGSIVFLDIFLSADNVVVIAMVAQGVPQQYRSTAITYGMVLAAALRVTLALFATLLLANHWIGFIGGVALLYVAYKLGIQLYAGSQAVKDEKSLTQKATTLLQGLAIIMLADISMSLENVLAVAALARHHWFIMILGIIVSIYFLTVAAKGASALLEKYKWLNWVGLAIIVYIAFGLIFGSYDVTLNTIQR